MSDLMGNYEDKFSRVTAHIILFQRVLLQSMRYLSNQMAEYVYKETFTS